MARQIFKPRPYQLPMMEHMFEHRRSGVLARMGMGKSCAALTAIDAEFAAGVETKPALILAPLRVAQNTWPDESKKWEHLKNVEVLPIVGNAYERRKALSDVMKGKANVATINYENIPWLIEEQLNRGAAWPFGRVIADESTKLKSFRLRQGGKRASAIARVAHTQVRGWTNLTGTPSPNGLVDLWGQVWMIDAGQRLGRTFKAFEQRWFRPSFDGYGIEPLPFAQEQIEDAIRDICLSLDPRDYFDLAQPVEHTVYVDLPKKARARYEEMERHFYLELEGHEVEAFSAAAKSQKLLQLASGAVYVDPMVDDDFQPRSRQWVEVHDVKMQALEEIIEEAAGTPVLVAYHFNSTRQRLLRDFKKCRLLDKNPNTLREWNAGKIPLLAAHPASAGHGLNMQDGGNIIAHIDHDWNLENFDQINERIGPMRQFQSGHNRNVFHYYIVARDTVDEVVMARRKMKGEVQTLLMQALKKGR